VTKPSISALLPELVPKDRLDEAVALNTLQFIIGQLLGPLLATLVLAVAGAAAAFLINALTFVGPILAMAYLLRRGIGAHAHADDREAVEGGRAKAGPSGVVAYIRANGWIGQMLITVVCASAAMEVARTTAPALAAEQLRVGESGAGIIVAAQSFGSAIGVFTFVTLRNRLPAGIVAPTGMAIQAVGLVGLAFSSSLLLASASVTLVGLGFSMAFPVPTGALQKDVDPSYRGRVMSVHQVAHLGVRPFAALAVGAIAAGFGLATASLLTIVILPIGIAAIRRGLGHRRTQEEAAVVPAT
jgi:MFS family permease